MFTVPPNPVARLIILHGYGEHAGRYVELMQWMENRQIACHAIDFRGHGESTGKRGYISRWNEYLDDLAGLLGHPEILATDSEIPIFILGHSHGGLIAAAAGERNQLQCAGVILTSPYLQLKMRVAGHMRLFARVASIVLPSVAVKSGIKANMLSRDEEMTTAARSDKHSLKIATPRWFVETQKVQKQVRENAGAFSLPLLMLVAKDDAIANPQAAIDFYRDAGSKDKMLKEYEGFKHELLREVGREGIFGEILEWMSERMNKV